MVILKVEGVLHSLLGVDHLELVVVDLLGLHLDLVLDLLIKNK